MLVKAVFRWSTAIGFLWLAACSSSAPEAAESSLVGSNATLYSISGNLIGLQGSITLQNNGAESVTLTGSGNFSFATQVAKGFRYNITVSSQPTGQTCTVTNGSGTINNFAIDNISVNCITSYSVGGTVSGLSGEITLINNGSDALVLNTAGDFTFSQRLLNGGNFGVAVQAQPRVKPAASRRAVA